METTKMTSQKKVIKENDNFRIDAIKMKDEIQAQMYEEYEGDFSLKKHRALHKKFIREGKSFLYSSVEEYEELCQKDDESIS